jgi:hypothetical protein
MHGWIGNSLQVPQEDPRAVENIDGLGGRIAAATTSTEVLAEPHEHSVVQVMIGQASAVRPMHEVFGCSNVSAGSDLRITLAV